MIIGDQLPYRPNVLPRPRLRQARRVVVPERRVVADGPDDNRNLSAHEGADSLLEFVGSLDLALPDDKALPSGVLQRPQVASVALAVPRELGPPVVASGLGYSTLAATGVQVPEAAVHKNDLLMTRKHNVR